MSLLSRVVGAFRPQLKPSFGNPVCYYYLRHVQEQNKKEREWMRNLKDTAHKQSLIVFNLPYQAAKEDLESYFSKFGKIEYIKLPYDENGMPCKSAEVKFEDTKALEEIASSKIHLICNKTIIYHLPKGGIKKNTPNITSENELHDLQSPLQTNELQSSLQTEAVPQG